LWFARYVMARKTRRYRLQAFWTASSADIISRSDN
jgi:hypothetical protein